MESHYGLAAAIWLRARHGEHGHAEILQSAYPFASDMRSKQHVKGVQTSPQHAIAHNPEVALWQRHKWPAVIFAAAHHHGFWRGGSHRGAGLEGKEPTAEADAD